jgi:hypothetical protein
MRIITSSVLLAFPTLALAQEIDVSYFESIINEVANLINDLLPVVMGLALLFFLWGVFVYFIYGAGNEDSRETGRKFMIYALIGLVLMVAVWGIVQLIIKIFGVGNATTPKIPPIPRF